MDPSTFTDDEMGPTTAATYEANQPREAAEATTTYVEMGDVVKSRAVPSEGSYASLRRSYNWRQSMAIFRDRIEEMQRLRKEPKALADVKAYYRSQIEQAELFMENDEKQRKASIHPNDERCTEHEPTECDDAPLLVEPAEESVNSGDEDSTLINFATRGSLALNILLFAAKVFLVIRSGSMAFIASLVDSALDLFSGAVMVAVAHAIAHAKYENYPTGKHKFESIGTLVFACAMFIASAKIIEECVYSLIDISRVDIELEIVDYVFIGFVIVSKGIAHILCRRCSNLSSTIEALADDHRNDVLTNTCAVLAVFAARYISRYFDPGVGMATAFFMMFNWACTAYEQATALSGASAEPQYINALTMIARNHDPRVLAVDTVRAVTSGSGHLVEIDLLLPRNMSLEEAHDIGERLQVFLENCEELEIARAYVHLDYETDHNPVEHR